MKKVVGPMDSTEEYEIIDRTPVKKDSVVKKENVVKKNVSKKNVSKKRPDNKRPRGNKKRTKDWSFYAIVICLIVIIIPAIYMGVSLYRAYTETGRPVIGHRFDNDLSPRIEDDDVSTLQSSLETIEGVDAVNVELTTATVRIYMQLPAESGNEIIAAKAHEAEALLFENLSREDYFTSLDSQLQYDYEIYAHDPLGEEATMYLLNKSSRMEEANAQYLSAPASQEMVDEIWAIQEELDNPTEEEDVIDDLEQSEDDE